MIGMVLVTHGKLAAEFLAALEHVVGKQQKVATVCIGAEDGDATALLIVPAGFQNAVIGTGSARLQLVTNPSQRVLPAVVRQMVEVLVEGAFYAQRLFAEPIDLIASSSQSLPAQDANVATIAVAINQRLMQLQGGLHCACGPFAEGRRASAGDP